MTVLVFSALVLLVSGAAGCLGALTGLGGGVILVPVLVLLFNCDIHYAAGASLISVIATSSGAAAAFLKEGFSNVRVAMFLEVATTCGALLGAHLAGALNASVIAIIFGLVMAYSALGAFLEPAAEGPKGPHLEREDPISKFLRLEGHFPDLEWQAPGEPGAEHLAGNQHYYRANNVVWGFLLMSVAGAISGLLGIGSGALKVLAMDRVMGLPIKVSTTTSNFMIGVTAAASAGVYLRRGYVDPALSMPVMLGVLAGSFLGARLLPKAKSKTLRRLFGSVMLLVALEMIYKGACGGL